ncbi:MAG: hypothetical protein WD941_06010, partial [Opitutus sp.]
MKIGVPPRAGRRRRPCFATICLLALTASLHAAIPTPNSKGQTPNISPSSGAGAPAISPADQQFFEGKVPPLLIENCYP